MKGAFLALFLVSNVQAHSLWVNSFESFAHKPGHTTVALGWGHSLPIDDMPNSVNARVVLEKFCLVDPNGNKTRLKMPETQVKKPFVSTRGFDIFDADMACQKIALKKDTPKGVYLIEAVSKKKCYTRYTDKKGRQRLALKPMNEIDDIQKVMFSVQYQAFAKSYLAVGEWKWPKPCGHGLEITPLTDLSKVRVGDLVEFDVRFNDKPLSYSPTSIEYITAHGSSFGLADGFALFSYVSAGRAQFRVQSAGQWLVNIFHNEPITQDGPLKALYNKVTSANYGATLTFTVK